MALPFENVEQAHRSPPSWRATTAVAQQTEPGHGDKAPWLQGETARTSEGSGERDDFSS
jgi:hypothetical protein